MKQILVIVLIIVGFGLVVWYQASAPRESEQVSITNFDECVGAGNAVMESYPRQCHAGDASFVEDIGNELEKKDLTRVENPRPNQVIKSPLTIKGEARGFWFFEASFPVRLLDADGNVIPLEPGYIMTANEWMVEDFVPFEGEVIFNTPESSKGTLILQKDNPSGLPEHNDELRIPVRFR